MAKDHHNRRRGDAAEEWLAANDPNYVERHIRWKQLRSGTYTPPRIESSTTHDTLIYVADVQCVLRDVQDVEFPHLDGLQRDVDGSQLNLAHMLASNGETSCRPVRKPYFKQGGAAAWRRGRVDALFNDLLYVGATIESVAAKHGLSPNTVRQIPIIRDVTELRRALRVSFAQTAVQLEGLPTSLAAHAYGLSARTIKNHLIANPDKLIPHELRQRILATVGACKTPEDLHTLRHWAASEKTGAGYFTLADRRVEKVTDIPPHR